MGFTKVSAKISNFTHPNGSIEVELLVDTGATYTSIPRAILSQLHVQSFTKRILRTADGHPIERDVGEIFMELQGQTHPIYLLFGEEDDLPLLGVTAMEVLGFEVDPVSRTLKQVPLIQA